MRKPLEEYTFATAYIGSFVSKLMNKQDLMRLAQAKDLAAIESILVDFGYGEAKELYDGDIEFFIRREQNRLIRMIFSTVPRKEEMGLFTLPMDYHNVKVSLKSEFLGITPDDNNLVSSGGVSQQKIMAMVKERNYTHMSSYMRAAIEEAVDTFSRSRDPQMIDIILDKACYEEMYQMALNVDVEFVIDLVKKQIDLLNLKAFVRLRQMGKSWSIYRKVYLDHGNVPMSLFTEHWEESYSQVADRLAPYKLKEVLEKGAVQIVEKGDFSLLEKLCSDALMEYNKAAKYESFGIAPIVAYWLAKEVEIDNLRIILLGKKVGLPPESIIERLREPYV
ncbi:MAG: V-type ATPase subunit [Clostridiales bacterium]|nr:V-type ATPase subunit [Clostridiales bacterium]